MVLIHGRDEEAEALVTDIERQVAEQTGQTLDEPDRSIKIRQRRAIGFGTVTKTVRKLYRKRVDKLKGEQASPVEGGDGRRFERRAGDTTTRTPGGAA